MSPKRLSIQFILELSTLILLLLLAAAIVSFSWVGYIASDDMMYAEGAKELLSEFPYIGENHWALRYTLVVPIAISFAFFGISEYSLTFVATLYFFANLLLIYYSFSKVFNYQAAFLVILLFATTPLFAVYASIPNVDIVELFYVYLSIWFFYLAVKNSPSLVFLLYSGMAAGLAWWTRETSIALLIFYFFLFLFGYRIQRWQYFLVGIGFAFFFLSELVYYWLLEGDPLYRIWIDLDQGRSSLPKEYLQRLATNTGNLELTPFLNPLLALLFNDEFGLIFFITFPALIWMKKRRLGKDQYLFAWLITGLGMTWFITKGYIIPGVDLPRYYSVTAFGSVAIIGIWLSSELIEKRKTPFFILTFLLITTNISFIYASNREPRFGERTLVLLAKKTSETIYTDPFTLSRARLLLEDANVSDRVNEGLPLASKLYYYNPNAVAVNVRSHNYVKKYSPKKTWKIVKRVEPSRKVTQQILEWLKVYSILPGSIRKKISPNAPVVLYRSTEMQ